MLNAENGARAVDVRKAILAGLACVLLALAGAGYKMKLWKADPRVPFAYGHDSLVTLMWVKTILDTGWGLTNDYLGAPFGLELYDYPCHPSVHFLVIKALSAV